MAISRKLTDFLEENLAKVTKPSSYGSLHQKLAQSKPTHKAPAIKQSPENSQRLEEKFGSK